MATGTHHHFGGRRQLRHLEAGSALQLHSCAAPAIAAKLGSLPGDGMQRLECERMFAAVMETGSFAEAARRLGTSSGQASKLVSRLEADLGVRLLNRTTRALSPTEVGQAYYERIRAVIEELDALGEAVKNRSGSVSGRLKLTAPLSFGNKQLVPALVDFATRYPGGEPRGGLLGPGGEPRRRGLRRGGADRPPERCQHRGAQAMRVAHRARGLTCLSGEARSARHAAGT